jgi:hypothetical protein
MPHIMAIPAKKQRKKPTMAFPLFMRVLLGCVD